MRCPTLLMCFAFASAALLAQDAGTPEIRGVVIDPFLNSIGVSGAEITLSQVAVVDNAVRRTVLGTATTDARGAFKFNPGRVGEFDVEARKEQYVGVNQISFTTAAPDSVRSTVTLTRELDVKDIQFSLTHPGELTGRVEDEEGRPVADVHLGLHSKASPLSGVMGRGAVSGKDGSFTASGVLPGSYSVQVLPVMSAGFTSAKFSDKDFKTVDQDFESSFWPGGTPEPQASVVLASGGQANVGVIRIRKVSYYRVHLSIQDSCEQGPNWRMIAIDVGSLSNASQFPGTAEFECRKDVVIGNIRPGSYQFAFSNELYGDKAKWAIIPVQISRSNVEIRVAMSPPSAIQGRFVAVEGASLPPLGSVRLTLRPSILTLPEEPLSATPDAAGDFAFTNVPWPSQQIQILGVSPAYYVKEIRAGGAAAPDKSIPLIPGAPQQVEIVLDDQPSTLAGYVTDQERPASQATILIFQASGQRSTFRTGTDGRFQIGGLTPGDYRILALPQSAFGQQIDADTLSRLSPNADSFTLERGGAKTLNLKLTDPSR